MSLLGYLIALLATGLLVGAIARLALPGADRMTVPQTILLGVAGNAIAGIALWLLWGRTGAGILVSIACSSLILYLIRRSRGGGLTRPGTPRKPTRPG